MPIEERNPSVPQAKFDFIDNFYRLADDLLLHDEYANQFTPNGILQLDPTPHQGREAIKAARVSKLQGALKTTHKVAAIYPLNAKADDVMVRGETAGELEGGISFVVNFAGRIEFERESGLIKKYEIWAR